jgi:hypothetical protein
MRAETAQSLILAIGNAAKLAIDTRNKITALERVLEKEQPALYSAYQKELEKVRKDPVLTISLEGLSSLQGALVQDSP